MESIFKKYKNKIMTDKELECIGTTVAILTRHAYWKDELWKKRKATKKKYKNYDPADIHNALLALRLLSVGIYTTPCGAVWCHEAYGDTDEDKKQNVLDYYKEYDELFDDYWQWQIEQR